MKIKPLKVGCTMEEFIESCIIYGSCGEWIGENIDEA